VVTAKKGKRNKQIKTNPDYVQRLKNNLKNTFGFKKE
jgi:hypothetical protein